MELNGYVNIRHAGHEKVLREAGFEFDVFLSQKLWRTYVVDKDLREQDTRIWDVLFMARTGMPGPAAAMRRPCPYKVWLKGEEVTVAANVPKEIMAFCISLFDEVMEGLPVKQTVRSNQNGARSTPTAFLGCNRQRDAR